MLSNIIADFELNLLWNCRFQGVFATDFVVCGEKAVRRNSLQRKAMNKVILHLFFDK